MTFLRPAVIIPNMNDGYKTEEIAKKYLEFLNSENGRIQQDILWEAISEHLPKETNTKILDAGCGSGWLSDRFMKIYPQVWGFDISEPLINHAKKNVSGLKFQTASLVEPLPYEDNFFDVVILNMVAIDVGYLPKMFENVYRKLSPEGQLLMTVPNPYYAEPVGEWKRSLVDVLLGRKPKLKIKNPYIGPVKIEREFHTTKITSYHYPLSTYLNTARSAGFNFKQMEELKSSEDSKKFNLQYQMFRYPLILLFQFTKSPLVNFSRPREIDHPSDAKHLA
jgi:ubiquinone/menaquinone biosynthesis C-methylase UbiE